MAIDLLNLLVSLLNFNSYKIFKSLFNLFIEIRSNSDEYSVDQNGGDSISSSLSNSVNIKSSYLAILLFLIISFMSVLI